MTGVHIFDSLLLIISIVSAQGITNLPDPGKCGRALLNRIQGGNLTSIDEYPWMALLEYDKGNGATGLHCGGSLINNRYVLTAAHCVSTIPATWTLKSVRLGDWDTSTSPDCVTDIRDYKDCADPHVDVTIEKVIPHDNYNPNSNDQSNDIALLRLSRNVDYSDFIQPICLPVSDKLKKANFDGTVMDIAGWGITESGSKSNIKLKATVPVVPVADCKQIYSQRNKAVGDTQICAGGTMGVDSCRGDSGGPLIGLDGANKAGAYYFIVGIISYGPSTCGLDGWPAVHTKVSQYMDWIQGNLAP